MESGWHGQNDVFEAHIQTISQCGKHQQSSGTFTVFAKTQQLTQKTSAISCCRRPRTPSSSGIDSVLFFQERQRAAAAVHIQRVARGRVARKVAASVSISHDVPVLPLPPVYTPTAEPEHRHRGSEEDGGFASSSAAEGSNDEKVAAESAEDGKAGAGTAAPLDLSVEIYNEDKLALSASGSKESGDQQREPSPVVVSKREEVARAQAASKIQVG